MATANKPDSEPRLFARIAIDYWEGLKGVLSCPRELWIAYGVKVLESLAYFSTVLVLMIFLTEDMGLSDTAAGTIFGVWSASMSLFMMFVGFIADSMGIKRALIVGLIIALVGRVLITFTTVPWIVYVGLFALSIGFAYMIPLLAAAVKLFSKKGTQSYAFSWYYVVMNVGSFLAGISLDWMRGTFTEPLTFQLLGLDLTIRPLQMIFFIAVVATLVSLVAVVFLIRPEIPAHELGLEDEPAPEQTAAEAKASDKPATKKRESAWAVMLDVISENRFWVFMTFIFLLVLVKMIFQYNHSLYPVYMQRIGLKEWTGKIYSINPIIIIFLVPVMTAVTSKMRGYSCITLGSFIAAGSVFALGFGEAIYAIVAFQVILSFGEAIYSPRIYDYTASIAPPGREASYMAYSKAPMFFAKVAAGPITGLLLANLCPAEGPRNTELMWIIVGASTMVSPIALLLLRRWLDVQGNEKAKAEAAAEATA